MLYAAAQWPVFDFLQRLALRPRLEDDVPKSDDSEEEEETGDALFFGTKTWRLNDPHMEILMGFDLIVL